MVIVRKYKEVLLGDCSAGVRARVSATKRRRRADGTVPRALMACCGWWGARVDRHASESVSAQGRTISTTAKLITIIDIT